MQQPIIVNKGRNGQELLCCNNKNNNKITNLNNFLFFTFYLILSKIFELAKH